MSQYTTQLCVSMVVVLVMAGLTVGTGIAGAQTAGDPADVDVSDLAGSGTPDDPYVVTTAPELQAMEDDPDASFELGSDIDASGTAEWNDGSGFAPIPDFEGHFDGNQHTITGLSIDRTETDHVGLFGAVNGGHVERVHLSGISINGNNEVGGLAGSLDNGTVSNVSTAGTVVGGDNVGGVVGSNYLESTVTHSFSTATVTGTTAGRNSTRTGGLVGGNYRESVITQSYATGAVDGGRTGGLVGENFNNSSVANSYAAGSVTSSQADVQAGGLVGGNFWGGSVVDSYWDVEASGQPDSGGNAIGLTTAEMTGEAALTNMTGLAESVWEPRANDYPALRAHTSEDSGSGSSGTLGVSLSDSTITVGTQTSLTVTVTDAGTGDAVEGATVEISDLQQSATTDTTGTATLTVTPSMVGEYPVSVSADGYTDETATLTVLATGQGPEVVEGSPSTDIDGDGKYEDVNGDGEFDIVDVNAFFQNRQIDAVQANVSAYDFNDDGQVNIVDVNRMFQNSQA